MGAYIVGQNMPGYLPIGDPFATETFSSARDILLSELRQAEDDMWTGEENQETARAKCQEFRSARGEVRKMRARHFAKDRFSGDTVYADDLAYWIHYDPDIDVEEYNAENGWSD